MGIGHKAIKNAKIFQINNSGLPVTASWGLAAGRVGIGPTAKSGIALEFCSSKKEKKERDERDNSY